MISIWFCLVLSVLGFIVGWFFGPCRFSDREIEMFTSLALMAEDIHDGKLFITDASGNEVKIFHETL